MCVDLNQTLYHLVALFCLSPDSHSEEYEKLHIKSDVLVEKLAAVRCSENLAFKLRAKKIIPESVYDRATAPGPQMVQIRIIINAVLPKVDNSAENYRTFLCTLQEIDEDYPKIVDGMKLYCISFHLECNYSCCKWYFDTSV